MPKFSIITINYGHSEKIAALWESLQKKSPKDDFEFIAVDNASPKDDGEALKSLLRDQPNAHTILLNKNLGFGGGYGEGIKFASGEYVGIINPDIEVKENCLEELVKALEDNSDAAITVPILENPDGTLQQNARKFPSLKVMFGRRLSFKFKKAYDTDPVWYESKDPVAIDWAQGSFLFMKRDFFEHKLKGFDSRFFLFLEDTDLCRRTWIMGKKVLLVPTARATHGIERLSGNDFWHAVRKKTFWIHVMSAAKYFLKYAFKKKPKVS